MSDNYFEKNEGIVKDANVLSTSFNETIKTQIKTDSFFIVVIGLPQLTIGEKLICKVKENNEVIEIKDAAGNWYKVSKP